MSVLEQENYAVLRTIALGHIDEVHQAMQEIAAERAITEPERYSVPIMIDQSQSEKSGFHFRIGFTTLAARLALKKTSVVIPLVVSSFEVTPSNEVIPYDNTRMRIGGDCLRTSSLLTGRKVTDRLWQYIENAPEKSYTKVKLFEASTLLDQARQDAAEQSLIPIL